MPKIEIIDVDRDDHGEGPVWLAGEQALVWADVYDNPSIQRYEPATGSYRSTPMPRITSCLAPRRNGGLLAGMMGGFYLLDDRGEGTLLVDPAVLDGQELLTTQFYVQGDPGNARDFLWRRLGEEGQAALTRPFVNSPDGLKAEYAVVVQA